MARNQRNQSQDGQQASDSATERDTAPETDTSAANLQETQPTVVERVVEKIVYVDRPVPAAPSLPRQMRVERQSDVAAPATRVFPQIRGGICEFCGVLDKNVPSQFQYKLCNHYRGMAARCSYCKPERDADDVNYHTVLNAYEDPFTPGVIIFCCSLSECQDKHYKRFTRNS